MLFYWTSLFSRLCILRFISFCFLLHLLLGVSFCLQLAALLTALQQKSYRLSIKEFGRFTSQLFRNLFNGFFQFRFNG